MLLNMLIWLYIDLQPLVSVFIFLIVKFLFKLQQLLITLCFLLLSFNGISQEVRLNYTLYNDRTNVGYIEFSRTDSADLDVYNMKMQVQVDLKLYTIRILDHKQAIYSDGILEYARMDRRLQNRELKRKITKRSGGKLYSDGEKPIDPETDEIRFSTLLMFTQEPDGINMVYSEGQLRSCPLEKVGNHHYRIVHPEGHSNDYFYNNGVCYQIVTNSRWAQVTALLE